MLDCVNVVKRYGGKFAVNGMSVAIEDAHIYGLLGPNGSGKSTWMKMAAGLIVPDEGQMTLDGVKIGAETKRHIAYMPTEGYFYSYMKIKDVGRYYQDFFDDFDEQQFEKLIADMDLEMNMKVRNLSSGMMAKLKIAVTLSRKAELYLLDEPENSLSPERQQELVRFIEDSARFFGCQFVIATHSPFLLAVRNARIYDMDEEPVDVKRWTQLPNVRAYYDFFKKHKEEFE